MSNWITIYNNTNANEVDIAKSVLEENGIDVVLVNKTDSMHIHLLNGGIELHVSPENVVKAKHIISKNAL